MYREEIIMKSPPSMCITGIQLCNVYDKMCAQSTCLVNIKFSYVSHNTYPNGGEKQSYTAFYETHALLKQKCGWEEWETDSFVWLKNYRHKENVYNAF